MEESEFYRTFAALCKQQGMSPTECGAKAGIKASTVSGWKTDGAKPQNKNLLKLAKVLNVSVEELEGKNVSNSSVQTNHGAIGNFHAPVTISNGQERALSSNEIEMLRMFTKLEAIDQAKVLVFTHELLEKNKK